MDFTLVFENVLRRFNDANVRYVLIGGLALGAHGIFRATMDVDLLLLSDDLAAADDILKGSMYVRVFTSENVSQYSSDINALGSIDILHAFRETSRAIIGRAVKKKMFGDIPVYVAIPEDIIGLKLQALCNDPDRKARELNDIESILSFKNGAGESVDWDLLQGYFAMFRQERLLKRLRKKYK